MRQYTKSLLFQITTCHLYGAKLVSEPILTSSQLDSVWICYVGSGKATTMEKGCSGEYFAKINNHLTRENDAINAKVTDTVIMNT